MKKFILAISFLILFGTPAGTGMTNKVWVVPKMEVPLSSNIKIKNLVEHLAEIPESILDPHELQCLSKNIYFEAAVESTAGKIAVAQVTLNRVKSEQYPETICKVVYEGPHYASGHPKRNRCQFSWYCDGKIDTPNESPAWRVSQKVAEYVIRTPSLLDITDGATHYHADYIDPPRWAKADEKTVQIDTHLFYNKKNSLNF